LVYGLAMKPFLFKRHVIAGLRDAMAEAGVTNAELARRMKASRLTVVTLFDGDKNGTRLSTVCRAIEALDLDLDLSFSLIHSTDLNVPSSALRAALS
jgi:hypothetical protein